MNRHYQRVFVLGFVLVATGFALGKGQIISTARTTPPPLVKLTPVQTLAQKQTDNAPKIQIAILLDSSNSMDGLIEQTRTQLWKIVNALSSVSKNGKQPVLEVALYHYGNNSLPSAEGFNRLLSGFSPELDLVSEKLFTIKTNGGQEYAGWVIQSAIAQLEWSNRSEDFRTIFIAGNEPFNQGSVDWQISTQQAVEKDVLINTIYCGEAESNESQLWAKGAEVGQGSFFNINQNKAIAEMPTPYDDQISDLNQQLNQTYIPYGSDGKIGQQRQVAEDKNAAANPSTGAAATRAESKSAAYYSNSSWDLVDALTNQVVSLESLNEKELPESLQGKTQAEKKRYIDAQKQKRATIQSKIASLSKQRADYIRDKKKPSPDQDTLDVAMINALKKQLASKGFLLK